MNTTRHKLALGALLTAALGAHAKLSVATTGNISFGRFAAGSGGTVSIDPNGARSRSGGVVLLASSPSAASYTLTETRPNTSSAIVILTLPANGSVALTAGANSMALSNFVSSRPAGGVLGPATQPFTVGATLNVAPNQPPGNYSGSFQITIEYQ